MPVAYDILSAGRQYTVTSERHVLALRAADLRKGVVISDEYFASALCASGITAISLRADEVTKSFDSLSALIVDLRAAGATRDSHLWAIGGGVIQDTAAFAASIYMRGIAWTYVPTTLLSMVDSCIGGKSSINVGRYKNIVGTFHPPSAVLIDAGFTATLTVEQRIAGLCEAAKICYCRGADCFEEYLALAPHAGLEPSAFEKIIDSSLAAKKWFIEIDEFDRAERLLLNLGHTFGHALEGASRYRISHGVAVGIGMVCALVLSRELLGFAPRGAAPLLQGHVLGLLSGLADLRMDLDAVAVSEAFEHIGADKKHDADSYRFVTFDADGRVGVTRLPKTDRTRKLVITALRTALDSLTS